MGKFLLTMSFLSLFSFVSCSFANGNDKKEMKSSEIVKMINKGKDVQLNDKIIVDDLDFTQLKKVSFATSSRMEARVDVNVFFCNCVFMGKVTTSGKYSGKMPITTSFSDNLVFFDCDFRGEANFDGCNVKGSVEFSRSVFREEASFNNCNFGGQYVRFVEIETEKKLSMCFASVFGGINFKDAKFGGDTYMQGLRLGGNLMCINSKFASGLDLSNSTFTGDVLFNYSEFGGEANFSFSRYLGRCEFMHSTFNGKTSFEHSLFFSGLKMYGANFAAGVVSDDAYSILPPNINEVETKGTPLSIKILNTTNK